MEKDVTAKKTKISFEELQSRKLEQERRAAEEKADEFPGCQMLDPENEDDLMVLYTIWTDRKAKTTYGLTRKTPTEGDVAFFTNDPLISGRTSRITQELQQPLKAIFALLYDQGRGQQHALLGYGIPMTRGEVQTMLDESGDGDGVMERCRCETDEESFDRWTKTRLVCQRVPVPVAMYEFVRKNQVCPEGLVPVLDDASGAVSFRLLTPKEASDEHGRKADALNNVDQESKERTAAFLISPSDEQLDIIRGSKSHDPPSSQKDPSVDDAE